MAADLPLARLVLRAVSIADDLGFVALADLASTLGHAESRVIGGHMVQLHVYRWGLGQELYRQTQDADLGVPLMTAKDPSLVQRLLEVGYARLAGNRFGRRMNDLPIGADAGLHEAVIDLLVPARTSRPSSTRRLGPHLVTTEVPGLADAFRRPGVVVPLELTRMNGAVLSTHVVIPDELSALALKVMAWRSRRAARDAVDTWRCAEVALAAGVNLAELTGKTADIVREEVALAARRRDGELMKEIVAFRHLSEDAGDAVHTRLRAIVGRLLND